MADPYSGVISGIESGGRYGVLGPITRSGDRAYGKYGVMGANIPEWTKQYYGQSLTPQQFLRNEKAQDAVFQGKFVGEYVPKFGPEGAARAWFAGEGGMNNPNAKDMLGTTVQGYGQRFVAALGPYAGVSSPPITPGSPAPTLPPPVNVGGSPQAPAAPQQPTQQQPPVGMGAYPWSPPPAPQPAQFQFSPNPISQMAAVSQAPDLRGLQALLQNAPASLRALITSKG